MRTVSRIFAPLICAAVLAAAPDGMPRLARAATPTPAAEAKPVDVVPLLLEHNCLECHALDEKLVGPSFQQIVAKYANNPRRIDELARNIRAGGKGKWGKDEMPSFEQLSQTEAQALARYMLSQ